MYKKSTVSNNWNQVSIQKCKFGANCNNHPGKNSQNVCKFSHPPLQHNTFQKSNNSFKCKFGADCNGHPDRNPKKVCNFTHPPIQSNNTKSTNYVNQRFITNNLKSVMSLNNDMILEKCLELGKSEEAQFAVFATAIKLFTTIDQIKDILMNLPVPAHVKKTNKNDYTPYNIAAFKKDCSNEVFESIINIIHQKGYSIVDKNDQGESALEAIFENTNLSIEECNFRYMTIANIHDCQIINLIHRVFNGVLSNTKDWRIYIDYMRHALCINHELVIKIIAEKLIKRTIPANCSEQDKNASILTDFIIQCFSGANSCFKNMDTSDKTLKLFFELNNKQIPGSNELLHSLIIKAKEYALNSESEYETFEQECFGFLIGAFAGSNIIVDVYEQFVIDCLKPSEEFMNISSEIRAKMAIRAVVHANIKTQIITDAFQTLSYINGHITTKINLLFNIQPKINNTVKSSSFATNSKVIILAKTDDIDKIKFFNGLTVKNADDIIEDSIEKLSIVLDKYKQQKQREAVIKQLISCLIENGNNYIINIMKNIISMLHTHIKSTEIKQHTAYFENTFIPDICDDAPYAPKVWNKILECL